MYWCSKIQIVDTPYKESVKDETFTILLNIDSASFKKKSYLYNFIQFTKIFQMLVHLSGVWDIDCFISQ